MHAEQVKRIERLIRELRFGNRVRGAGALRRLLMAGNDRYAFCCLGVACDLTVKEDIGYWPGNGPVFQIKNHTNSSSQAMPLQVQMYYGFRTPEGSLSSTIHGEGGFGPMAYNTSLMILNDSRASGPLAHAQPTIMMPGVARHPIAKPKFTFWQIAGFIEREMMFRLGGGDSLMFT